MKKAVLLVGLMLVAAHGFSQKTIPIRNLWTRAQVHILFKEYKLSFSVRDLDRAIELANGIGEFTYGVKSGLDTAKDHTIELLNDLHTEYRMELEPMMQNCIGTFLLTKGLVVVENAKHKKLKAILMDYEDADTGETDIYIHFYDPTNHHLIFSGKMPINMYNQDMGIDYY